MKELVLCYYLGKHKKLPKIKGTFTIWRERNKNLHLNITAIPLNTQLNFILKQKMSKDEIRQIEIDSNCNENCTIAPTPAIVHNQHEDSCSDPIAKNTNDDYDLLVATYSAEIRTKYEECKNMEISKRAMPLKLQYNSENKTKMKACNEALESIIVTTPDLNIPDNLNSLYYATACIVAGVKKPASTTTPKNPIDPNAKAIKEIETLRKNIGRLTDYCNNPNKKKKSKIAKLVDKDPLELALQKLRMTLAAKCKHLRTKNEQSERFKNNSMFRNKQKAFYTKLRGEQTHKVEDPPPKEEISKFWKDIFGNRKEHNRDASWLQVEREEMRHVEQATW